VIIFNGTRLQLRIPAADPYPPELPMVPDQRAPIAVSEPA
jgi:hypothetical protein